MACIPFSGPGFVGHICCADHFVSLEAFGAKVWCEFHNYLGPTFYRSKNAIAVIDTPSRKTWKAFSAWHASTRNPTNEK
jgi:hypothetical protein